MHHAHSQSTTLTPGTLSQAVALLLLIFFSPLSQAILLKIDPARSTVTYTPALQLPICTLDPSGVLVCPPPTLPQSFTIDGDINADVIHEHFEFDFGYPDVDRDLLNLTTSKLSSGALHLGFILPGALGLMSGQTFEAQDHPCFLFVGPGSCSGWTNGPTAESEGTWDGQTLIWRGHRPSQDASFTYTITARVAAVPEPGTFWLLLLMPVMMFFSAGRRRTCLFFLLCPRFR